MRLRVDLGALDADVASMEADTREAAKPAAEAGARVLFDDVKRNVARIRRKTGNLARSIYMVYSEDNSAPGHAVYHVSWSARVAPHGHLIEFGHLMRYEVTYDPKTRKFVTHRDRPLQPPRQVAAIPFMRPATAKFPEAQQAMHDRFIEELAARGVVR